MTLEFCPVKALEETLGKGCPSMREDAVLESISALSVMINHGSPLTEIPLALAKDENAVLLSVLKLCTGTSTQRDLLRYLAVML